MVTLALVEDQVFQGIDRLLRIDTIKGSTEQELDNYYSKHVNVLELLEAFEVFRYFVRDTIDMIGKPKYHKDGPEFDFVTELMADMESYYKHENKMKYSKMLLFVFEPLIKLYQDVPHEEAVKQYEMMIERCIEFIMNNESEANDFDAAVVNKVLKLEYQALCKRRATLEVVAGIMRLRRKKRKKKLAA